MLDIPHDNQDDQDEPVSGGRRNDAQNDLITDLLFQIIRVKELIKHYEMMPGGEGVMAVSLLTELVTEAHRSLIDYDTVLMKKYYDMLLNCD